MIPIWLAAAIILSHLMIFALGVFSYHWVRVLAAKPLHAPVAQAPRMSEARMAQIANEIAKQQAKAALFNHLGPMPDVPMREIEIPVGDGRPPKEEAFAPMGGKK